MLRNTRLRSMSTALPAAEDGRDSRMGFIAIPVGKLEQKVRGITVVQASDEAESPRRARSLPPGAVTASRGWPKSGPISGETQAVVSIPRGGRRKPSRVGASQTATRCGAGRTMAGAGARALAGC